METEDGAAVHIAPVTNIVNNGSSAAASAISTGSINSDATELLALAMNMVGDNDETKDLIANALNAATST